MAPFGASRAGLMSVAVDDIPDSAILHLDAQSLTGFNDGQTVSTWSDESTEGNDLTGSAIYRENGINGNPSLEFDPAQDHGFTGTMTTSLQPNAVFAVFEWFRTFDEDDGLYRIFITRDSFTNLDARNTSGDLGWNMFAGQFFGGSQDAGIQMLTGLFDGASSEIRENGVVTNTGDPGSDGTGETAGVGIDADGLSAETTQIWEGYIGEILVIPDPQNHDIASIESTLMSKWGIGSGN